MTAAKATEADESLDEITDALLTASRLLVAISPARLPSSTTPSRFLSFERW